jgi:hypothetical protein
MLYCVYQHYQCTENQPKILESLRLRGEKMRQGVVPHLRPASRCRSRGLMVLKYSYQYASSRGTGLS